MPFISEPFTQADGDLANDWSSNAGLGGSDPIVKVKSNKGSTDNNAAMYVAMKLHGLDVSGDWQIDFDFFAPLITGDGGVTVLLLSNADGSGYGVFVGNAVHIQRYPVGGTPVTNMTNVGRTGEGNPGGAGGHCTLTHTAAGAFAVFIDGVAWGTISNTAVVAGNLAYITVQDTNSPTTECTIDNLVIQSSIGNPFTFIIDDIVELGGFANSTAGTTMTMTVPAAGVPIGDTIIISGACDNTGTNGVATTVTCADNSANAGTANTYTLQTAQAIADPGAAAAGVQGFFLVCSVTRSLSSGNVITVTLGNTTTSKAMQVEQWRGIKLTSPVVSYTTVDNLTSTTTSISRTPTAAGQLVMVLCAIEGPTADTFTQDSDVPDGTWQTLARRGSGAAAAGITVRPSYKLVSGVSAQTWNPVMGTARDHCAAAMVLDFEPAAAALPKQTMVRQAVQRAAVR